MIEKPGLDEPGPHGGVSDPAQWRVLLGSQVAEQRRRQVSLSEATHNRDDAFAFKFWASSNLRGRVHVGTATDAGHDPLVLRKFLAPLESIFVVHLDNVIDKRCIEIARNKPGANSLNAMLAGLPTTDNWTVLGLYGDRFEVWVHALRTQHEGIDAHHNFWNRE